MTETTFVTCTAETKTYINPIAKKFFDALDSATEEFKQNGIFKFSTIESIIGSPPVIPDSPDMDTRLEAYEEQVKYATKVSDIESKLRTFAGKRS